MKIIGPTKSPRRRAKRDQARRAARENMNLKTPLKIKLMPTKVPITHAELEGHCLQIKIPRIRVTSGVAGAEYCKEIRLFLYRTHRG